jgi:hypothetical protein
MSGDKGPGTCGDASGRGGRSAGGTAGGAGMGGRNAGTGGMAGSTGRAGAGASGETGGGGGSTARGGAGGLGVRTDGGRGGGGGAAGGTGSAGTSGSDGGATDGGSDGVLPPALPVVNYVAPYVAYLGEQLEVIIRGSGFTGATAVRFGDEPAASMELKSDSEIRAIPPVMDVAARRRVTVENAARVSTSSAELVVRAHPNYAYTALATAVGFQDRHVLYDAERDVVFSYCSYFGNYSPTTPSTINRYAYDGGRGTWTKTSSYVPSLWDIAMSPDGKHLIALGTSRLWLLDPVTFATQEYVDLTQTGLGTAGQLGVANDGKVLIRDLGVAYSLVTKTFSPARFPPSIGIVFSADGSRAVVGDANNSASVPLSIYDAGTGLITPSRAFEYFQLPSLDRTGARYFAGGNLRDQNLTLIGGVPTYLGYMRPDAKRAYETGSSDRTHIRVFDLIGNGPSFPQLADIVLPDTVDGYWLHASLDSRYLFIPGPDKFIVLPLP